MSDSSVIAL